MSEVSFSLVDTPGCNEYDTGIISYNVQSAENFSSAFIFVTTLDTYRDGKFSTILKKIYFKHPGAQFLLYYLIYKFDKVVLQKWWWLQL